VDKRGEGEKAGEYDALGEPVVERIHSQPEEQYGPGVVRAATVLACPRAPT